MSEHSPTVSSRQRAMRGAPPAHLAEYSTEATGAEGWPCGVCRKLLCSKDSLRRHTLTKHIRQRVHCCSRCHQTFVLKFQLEQHQRSSHSSTPPPQQTCICGRVFTKRNSFLCHVRRVHHPAPLQRPVCQHCSKVFNAVSTLRTHEARVHGPKTHPCQHEGCDKVFTTVGLRSAHYRYHQSTVFSCTVCEKTFSTASYRDKHILTHAGVRRYGCEQCGVRCITASQLGTHIKRQHGD